MPIGNFLEMYPELCLRGLKEMVSLGLEFLEFLKDQYNTLVIFGVSKLAVFNIQWGMGRW